MIDTWVGDCPCWHWIFNKEIEKHRYVTDPNCRACQGTGKARFIDDVRMDLADQIRASLGEAGCADEWLVVLCLTALTLIFGLLVALPWVLTS